MIYARRNSGAEDARSPDASRGSIIAGKCEAFGLRLIYRRFGNEVHAGAGVKDAQMIWAFGA